MRVHLAELRPRTFFWWLVVAAEAALLFALLLSPVRWASTGTMEISVRIVVFDAATSEPIENAVAAIVRAPPATGEHPLDEFREQFAPTWAELVAGRGGASTDATGSVTTTCVCGTGSSHLRPEPRAHTDYYWLLVTAEQYGSIAIPLRYESLTTESLREQQVLPAYVGLARPAADTP